MLTDKQIEFCKLVSIGKNGTEAYQLAYKSKKPSTCKAAASRMLKSSEINDQIKEFKEINRKINERGHEIAAKNLAVGEIADKIERMTYLSRLMRGKETVKQKFACGELGVLEEEVEANFSDRIKAIKELNLMTGDYAPTKTELTGKDGESLNFAPQITILPKSES